MDFDPRHCVATHPASLTCALALVVCLGAVGCQSHAPQPLVPGSQDITTLEGGHEARYSIDLTEGYLLDLEVEQRGIDVEVILQDPSGRDLVVVDGLLGSVGAEHVLWIAESSGTYGVTVRPYDDDAAVGEIAVLQGPPRMASGEDLARAKAAKLYYEACHLRGAGDYPAARTASLESLDRWPADETVWRSTVHFGLGVIALSLGDHGEAEAHYLAGQELVSEHSVLWTKIQHSRGDTSRSLFELEEAREHYGRARQGWQSLQEDTEGYRRRGYLYGEALTINNLGLVARMLGEAREALEHYEGALDLWDAIGEPRRTALTFHNRAMAFNVLGKPEQALIDLERARTYWEKEASVREMAVTLNGIGQTLGQLERFEEGRRAFEESMALETTGDDFAFSLVGLGDIHAREGDLPKAIELFEQALELFRETHHRSGESSALRRLGQARELMDLEGAERAYRDALRISVELNSGEYEASALLGLARVTAEQGQPHEALGHIERAIEIVEDLRQRPLMSFDMRSTYFATKQNYYDFYTQLLMRLADLAPNAGERDALVSKAFQASERARGRSLLEALRNGEVDFRRGGDEELLQQEARIEKLITAKTFQLDRAVARDQDARPIKEELSELLLQLDGIRTEIRETHPLYAEITQPQSLDIQAVQRSILDDRTLLLEYQLANPTSYLWAITSESLEAYELPSQGEIERLAGRIHALLNEKPSKVTHRGLNERLIAELSNILIDPAQAHLGKDRLVVVAEGALQKLPFAALLHPDSGEPLIASHEIAYLPSASLLAVLRQHQAWRQPPNRGVAVIAHPTYPTSSEQRRVQRDSCGGVFEQLPFTLREAKAILDLADGGDNLKATHDRATKALLQSDELEPYRYLHIATHGCLDPRFPELSSLVFALVDNQGEPQDGYLRAHEIYKLRLSADLVVLSACQTARGKDVHGEGIVGWTQGFLYAGARRVLVSLWNIDDEATYELMRSFYGHMLRGGLAPPEALRRAQQDLRAIPRWEKPAFWAGFVLFGEFAQPSEIHG